MIRKDKKNQEGKSLLIDLELYINSFNDADHDDLLKNRNFPVYPGNDDYGSKKNLLYFLILLLK